MAVLIEIDVTDEIQPLLERMAGYSRKNLKSAAKSLGWFLQREIKEGVRSGMPGGDSFAQRRPYEVRKALGFEKGAARSWYGRMVNAIAYQYNEQKVLVGWASKTSSAYAEKQEFGFVTTVTEQIRKRFAKAGYPLRKSTTELILPERPIFEPMAGELQSQIAPYVQNKLNGYTEKDVVFSKKARRKYKVY